MNPLALLIERSVRHRLLVLVAVAMFALVGIKVFTVMTFDALPSLTGVQVQVLTTSPGLAATEVEQRITVPIERAMAGLPGLENFYSRSFAGVSAITLVFAENTDIWLARQMAKERLDLAREQVPRELGTPELGPPITGLGEVYQFSLRGDLPGHELYRVFERDVAPRLRTVAGIVDVTAWGAGGPRLEIVLDPFALTAHGLSLAEARSQLEEAFGQSSGGAHSEGSERIMVRGENHPSAREDLYQLHLRDQSGRAIPLTALGEVIETSAPSVGLATTDGQGEALFALVQLLRDADALTTVRAVKQRIEEIRAALPAGVVLETVYDREKLVSQSLHTVALNLLEGGLLVVIVLFLLLGDLRAGLVVASVIPLAMLGAFCGLYLLGYSGNLMSLGAIDFGLIVDGTIVVVEAIVGAAVLDRAGLREAVVARSRGVAGPVLLAVGILLLVYVPILALWGVEGKLFRPMAISVLLALTTALLLTFTYVPALASLVLRPNGAHRAPLERWLLRWYEPLLARMTRMPWVGPLVAVALVAAMALVLIRIDTVFVPRLEEGDLVVLADRLPGISAEEAQRQNTRVERILREFPEVERVASRTGSPALATDPMGLEETDIFLRLAPKRDWRTASDLDGLIAAIAERLEREAPGAIYSFSQPIEMRFNEMLEGITSDLGIKIYGEDQQALLATAQKIAAALATVPGAADVAAPSEEGVQLLSVTVDEARRAQAGLTTGELLDHLRASGSGIEVGSLVRGPFRDGIYLRLATDRLALTDLPIAVGEGAALPFSALASLERTNTANLIQREQGSRRVIVEANIRGRDLGAFMADARRVVAAVDLPTGTWITWSGKFEQWRLAARRMGVLLPLVLLAILTVLFQVFRKGRIVALIFCNVPVAVSGGVILLMLREMPLSISAIVGLIALTGIAVMNGIVLLARIRELHPELGAREAARQSALERFRPVLMTAAVAGIGFLPMALGHGVGAEVQRPLATVVIGGLLTATPLTLLVLPAVYGLLFRRE